MEALFELFLKFSLEGEPFCVQNAERIEERENFKKASAYSGTARDRISKCLASENF